MIKKREKYLDKLPYKQKVQLISVIDNILSERREKLDIIRMEGTTNMRRCRIGNLRIIIERNIHGHYIITKIAPRWDVYK